MHAAIFDIDGTLLDSCAVDGTLFVDAVRAVLGDVTIRDGWEQYVRVTDTGILSDICSDNALRYDDALSDRICEAFVGLLTGHMRVHGPFVEVPGALACIERLRQRSDVQLAYATGGWRTSARLKLSSASFPLHDVPLASANDHPDREQIMRHALAQLRGPFDSITYFGDGIWDRQASAALGWHFVPVGPKLQGLTSFARIEDHFAVFALDGASAIHRQA